MNPFYVPVWSALDGVARLEKVAHATEGRDAAECQFKLAAECSRLYDFVRGQAVSANPRGSDPAGVALSVTKFAAALAFTKHCLGEKTAAVDDIRDILLKLATAAFVDTVLEGANASLTGVEKVAGLRVQLLGREYAVELMRELLA